MNSSPASRENALAGESQATPREQQLHELWDLIRPEPSGPPTGSPASSLSYRDLAGDKRTAHLIVREGVPPQAIAPLGELLGVGVRHIAEYLDIDRGTPARQAARGQPLPRHASEGVLRLLEIEQLAHDSFETEDEARDWLKRPHPMLDGETPLQAAGTSFGADEVRSILVAIRYGGVV